MKILRIILILLVSCTSIFAQNSGIESLIQTRGEAVLVIEKPSKNDVVAISKITSIDRFVDDGIVVYANDKQYSYLQKMNMSMRLDNDYYESEKSISMASSLSEMQNWDKYPTWAVFQDMMLNFATDYPDLCRLDTIGFSIEGKAIFVVKISDNVSDDEAEPEFFLSGQMHGDELVGYMIPLRMIHYLLTNYGSDDYVTQLVNEMEIWINPLSNPDGTYGADENDVSGSTRYNSEGIDLNRNFPDPEDGTHPDGNETAQENLAMMDFVSQRHFVMSGNTHSGAELLNYPYDTWPTLHADDEWWEEISREYADIVHENSPSGYLTDQENGITNGYAWYTANGTRQDYMNYFERCRELTFEWSTLKKLDSEDLPAHWDYNRDALLGYFAQALEGVHGIVTDSISDEPLAVEVSILGHDGLHSEVFSELPNGDYHRLLKSGSWRLSFSKEGYRTKNFELILGENERIDLDVQLVPLSELPPIASFYATKTHLDCYGETQFINSSEAAGNLSFEWDFGDGQFSNEENPVHNYQTNGYFTVSLTIENENGQDEYIAEQYIHVDLNELDSIQSDCVCETSGVLDLFAYSSGEIFWYDELFSDSPIHSGTSYTTPELTESAVFYAQSTFSGDSFSLGEQTNGEDGEYDHDLSMHSLIFDVFQEVEIQSVKVFAEESGERSIMLISELGDTILEKTVFINEGEQVIDLNFTVLPGDNYKLAANANSGLFKGVLSWFTEFDYPYEIENVIRIKDSDSGMGWTTASTQVYPYFYDWQIKTPDCQTERMPVFAIVNDSPTAQFSYRIDAFEVEFDNNSQFATNYIWDFGDSDESSIINPTHAYDETGEYQVSLTAQNDCGEDVSVESIYVFGVFVQDNEMSNIEIYPNPAHDFVKIQLKGDGIYSDLRIYDLQGHLLKIYPIKQNEIILDISNYINAYYLIEITEINGMIYHKKLLVN
jgi:PKD repeat protein